MDVIYLDSLFGLNLLIDYCLVLVSARVCGVGCTAGGTRSQRSSARCMPPSWSCPASAGWQTV